MPNESLLAPDFTNTSTAIDQVRTAIHANQITFPVPVPVFPCQQKADVQWRLVELYFVRGWTPAKLAERYRISSTRVRQSLRSWVRRATALGYLQPIPSENEILQTIWPRGQGAWVHDAPVMPPACSTGTFLPVRESFQPHI
jgi:hypothetical protein